LRKPCESSGRVLGELSETSGRALGEFWGPSGRALRDFWESSRRALGDFCESSRRLLGEPWDNSPTTPDSQFIVRNTNAPRAPQESIHHASAVKKLCRVVFSPPLNVGGGTKLWAADEAPRATQESIQDAQHARPPHPPRIKGERCQRVVLILGGCGGRPCCVSWIDSWGARGACCALCRTLRGRSQDPPRSLPVVFPSAWNLSGRGPRTGFLHKKRKI